MRTFQIHDSEGFASATREGSPLVITDRPTRRVVLHLGGAACPYVRPEYFHTKVVENASRNGEYWRVTDESEARAQWGASLSVCPQCAGLGASATSRRAPAEAPFAAEPPPLPPRRRTALAESNREDGEWCFDCPDPWVAQVGAAPKFETYASYFAAAVPDVIDTCSGRPLTPCFVVARVVDLASSGRRVGGPKDRAKGLLDALHDQRQTGPFYRDFGVEAPLPDDHPPVVAGLAVEVRAGDEPAVEYRIGSRLTLAWNVVGTIDVDASFGEAPNDIRESSTRLTEERERFAEGVVRGWNRASGDIDPSEVRGVLIRHLPFASPRDEDNTWATWLGSLRGTSAAAKRVWGAASPLGAAEITAVGSVADGSLPCVTRFELLGLAA